MLLSVARALREDHAQQVLMIVVYLSVLLDNMLLTVVVPIIPDYLVTTDGLVLAPLPAVPWPLTASVLSNGSVSVSGYTPSPVPPTTSLYWRNHSLPLPLPPPPPPPPPPRSPPLSDSEAGEQAEGEGGRVGLLLSSKAVVQLVANPVVGTIVSRVGGRIPLVAGTANLLFAALLFAVGESYMALFLARSLQGLASACIGVAGMSLVAENFPSEEARSRAMGVVLGGVALGVLLGYPLGGLLYDLVAKAAPFLLILFLSGVILIAQLYFLDLEPCGQAARLPMGWIALLTDWPVLGAAGAIWLSSSSLAILEPCLPLWLMASIKPPKWQLGTVFLPDSVGYFLGTNFMGTFALREGRWRVASGAMATIGLSAMLVPSARGMFELVIPHFLLGMGVGTADAALVPLLASLVDSRLTASYGAVYALQQAAVSLAYSLGPMVGGGVVRLVGFPWLMRGVGVLSLLYCLLLVALARCTPEPQSNALQAPLYQHGIAANYSATDGYPAKAVPVTKYSRFSDSDEDSVVP